MEAVTTRGTAKRIHVDYHGTTVTLHGLSQATGLSYSLLYERYTKGDRGQTLWRPATYGRGKTEDQALQGNVNTQLTAADNAAMRRRQEDRQATVLSKQAQRRQARAAVRASHTAEFSRPLIDASLLTHRERSEIRAAVTYSGQRMWSIKGGA